VVQGAQGGLRPPPARADDRNDRTAGGGFPRVRAGSFRHAEDVALQNLQGHAVSEDKTPLKTHVAAVFPHKTLGKGAGAGLYFEVAPGWVWVGGGMYAPDTSTIQAEREHIAANHARLRKILGTPSFKRIVGRLEGEQLKRVPRGFDKEHPAADLLKYRQFLAGAEFPQSLATSPRFYSTVLTVFRQISPLIAFLNEPLVAR
jgi:uncharacterized protein (TIGR02453 family)